MLGLLPSILSFQSAHRQLRLVFSFVHAVSYLHNTQYVYVSFVVLMRLWPSLCVRADWKDIIVTNRQFMLQVHCGDIYTCRFRIHRNGKDMKNKNSWAICVRNWVVLISFQIVYFLWIKVHFMFHSIKKNLIANFEIILLFTSLQMLS